MNRQASSLLVYFSVALMLPLFDFILPLEFRFAHLFRSIFIFSLLGLGLNIVTGYTGLLQLGAAAFMAIGTYTYAILTCDIYPFQLGFWSALFAALLAGAFAGLLLGLPTIRLRGDYLAIVTLGFGEIIQDVLKNLETITKGTQGINPLPPPSFFGYAFTPDVYQPWYYLFLGILGVVVLLNYNLENSRVGRIWMSVREDELAASCMGVRPVATKLVAFSLSAALCSFSGALYASYLGSSGEPGNYDFQVSIIALCTVIVGGLGSIRGVLIGSLVMVGFNSIFLAKLTDLLARAGISSTENVLTMPGNWKYLVFGLALVVMMRFKPDGLLPHSSQQGGRR